MVMAGALLACSLAGAQPTAEIIVEPTVRAESPSLPPTTAPELPTAPPEPTAVAPSLFRDDFNGVLDPGWSWWKSDAPGWSLSHMDGWLRLNLSTGSFFSASPPENLLVRTAPPGDFDMTTFLRFSPHNNFELAGLVVVFDDHSALQFGRGFCSTEAAAPSCIGDGLYFDDIQNGTPVGGNFATQALLGLDYMLQVQRQGNTYLASLSTDGTSWTAVGSHSIDTAPVLVGLIAAQATVANPYADFDYFQMQAGS